MSAPVRIAKMSYGGKGVAPDGVAVPFVLPGELVQIDPAGHLTVLEPSPDRVPAPCIHFGTCGGCHYQHVDYPAQLRIKQGILEETLSSAGLVDLPLTRLHFAAPWHYRNRIRLRAGAIDGELRLGYNHRDGNSGGPLLPVTMCPIASPLLWSVAETLMQAAKSDPPVQRWLAATVELELFCDAEETALQLTVFTRTPPLAGFDIFCQSVKLAIPQLAGAGVAILPKKPSVQGRRSEIPRPSAQWGRPGLIYKVFEEAHWVSRRAFFQVNRYLVAQLRTLATSGRTGRLAWDLYAGVGLFSRALTLSFIRVIAVEASEPAAADLAAGLNAEAKSPRGSALHRALPMTTLDFLQAAVVQRDRPDLIVMDPPRAGVGAEICALLARVQCPELVYVSCDPVTLARDLKLLTGSGYRLVSLDLVDMFPQTFHMETVAVLHM